MGLFSQDGSLADRARIVCHGFVTTRCAGRYRYGANVLLSARSPPAAQLSARPGVFSTLAIVLLIPGVGGASEEPGLRRPAVTDRPDPRWWRA
jgi:hypothetical protein